jgi:hypothetical protein
MDQISKQQAEHLKLKQESVNTKPQKFKDRKKQKVK